MYLTGNYIVSTAPTDEPLTLTEAKAWLKVSGSDEDTLITSLIQAARESAERYLGMAMGEQEITETFPVFYAWGFRLSVSPLISLTSIQYKDTGGNTQTLSASQYGVDAQQRPPLVYPKSYVLFPMTYEVPDAVTVVYQAGYADVADIPQSIKTAMLLMIAEWYDNRTDGVRTMPTASEILLNKYRVWTF